MKNIENREQDETAGRVEGIIRSATAQGRTQFPGKPSPVISIFENVTEEDLRKEKPYDLSELVAIHSDNEGN